MGGSCRGGAVRRLSRSRAFAVAALCCAAAAAGAPARADGPGRTDVRASAPDELKLDNSFRPASVAVGEISTLTFTVTGGAHVRRWSFTDRLSPGLSLTRSARVRTDCATESITADYGRNRIVVSEGGLRPGQRACKVMVGVTSEAAGTYRNGAANIADSSGLALPGSTAVTFRPVGG
ncbi:hypothetical protein DZF91_22070 [Actinomadura logoneensis]|uniref:DUF7933 domain-containing protein n=1 Tax=Actinomadura logoneensis TaxID=2293572 RepID=A0A372JJM5_9ACTN|nr:hypothetical protein [Actinomadura logoneensis]RFU39508.1 hypothetical protein DZF91_22070 [Actinomadura logoneensis]